MPELDLSRLPIRVYRDGKWQSLFINELEEITDAEILEFTWHEKLIAALEAAPNWTHSPSHSAWVNSQVR